MEAGALKTENWLLHLAPALCMAAGLLGGIRSLGPHPVPSGLRALSNLFSRGLMMPSCDPPGHVTERLSFLRYALHLARTST